MLSANSAILLVVDIQGKLAEIMFESAKIIENSRRLIEGVKLFDIPVFVTEQVPDKLGETREELKPAIEGITPYPKNTFRCYSDPAIKEVLKKSGRDQIIICGIETHVCVYQTALQLLADCFKVSLVVDAVSSRSLENKTAAIQRLGAEGVKIATTEMVLFELQGKAEGERFRKISRLIK